MTLTVRLGESLSDNTDDLATAANKARELRYTTVVDYGLTHIYPKEGNPFSCHAVVYLHRDNDTKAVLLHRKADDTTTYSLHACEVVGLSDDLGGL